MLRSTKTIASIILIVLLTESVWSKTLTYDFQVGWFYGNPDGVPRNMIGINGASPGPTIVADLGDTLVVNVTNVDIANGTTIHWHGLFQRGTNFMDGTAWVTQCPIPMGSTFQYEFVLNQTGTYWYHGHTMTNYIDGLIGALIINEPSQTFSYDEELLLFVGDWYHYEGFDLLTNFMSSTNPTGEEPQPNSILFNGVGQANCADLNPPIIELDSGSAANSGGDDDEVMEKRADVGPITSCSNVWPASLGVVAGKVYRLRIINPSAFTRLQISIDGHNLTVIEADGTLTQPTIVDTLQIDVAQRYSVLLYADQAPGRYTIRASADPTMGFSLSGTAIMQYSGMFSSQQTVNVPPKANPVVLNPDTLKPYAPPSLEGVSIVQQVQLDMVFNTGPNGMNMAYMDNSSYMPSPMPLIWTAYLNDPFNPSSNVHTVNASGYVLIVLNNRDDGDHPFHLHGHKLGLVSVGAPNAGDFNGDTTSLNLVDPLFRDVFTVHQGSYIVLLMIADNPGVWLMHCHIEWHMEAGLAVVFNELPSEQNYVIPDDIPQLCTSPVAPPNMADPASFGGTFIPSATSDATTTQYYTTFVIVMLVLVCVIHL